MENWTAPAPRRLRAVGAGEGGSGDGADRQSLGGRGSIGGGTIASSAGTALSDAPSGNAPFVDQISKVQRLQRSRLRGRFSREARMQRRWEELKATAIQLQQQKA